MLCAIVPFNFDSIPSPSSFSYILSFLSLTYTSSYVIGTSIFSVLVAGRFTIFVSWIIVFFNKSKFSSTTGITLTLSAERLLGLFVVLLVLTSLFFGKVFLLIFFFDLVIYLLSTSY